MSEITDGQARRIATEWHEGHGPLTQFATTGAIADPPALREEIERNVSVALHWSRRCAAMGDMQGADECRADAEDLGRLYRHVVDVVSTGGMRGPVPGWSGLAFE